MKFQVPLGDTVGLLYADPPVNWRATYQSPLRGFLLASLRDDTLSSTFPIIRVLITPSSHPYRLWLTQTERKSRRDHLTIARRF
jgi:hypothetical protein